MNNYEKVVAWIPHTGTFIPFANTLDKQVVADNLILSDLYVDTLFKFIPSKNKITTTFSRFVVDLERYADDSKEPMSQKGMGMLYTKTINGKPFDRRNIDKYFDFRSYHYIKHLELKTAVEKIGDGCILLDLHSFNDQPLTCDTDKTPNRPDICIGYNETISDTLKDKLLKTSSLFGKVLKFNTPFVGAMTVDTDVKYNSFMIEVNKKNYLINNEVCADAYKISFLLQRLVDTIVEETK